MEKLDQHKSVAKLLTLTFRKYWLNSYTTDFKRFLSFIFAKNDLSFLRFFSSLISLIEKIKDDRGSDIDEVVLLYDYIDYMVKNFPQYYKGIRKLTVSKINDIKVEELKSLLIPLLNQHFKWDNNINENNKI